LEDLLSAAKLANADIQKVKTHVNAANEESKKAPTAEDLARIEKETGKAEGTVSDLLKQNKIVAFVRVGCPFCEKAKAALKEVDAQYLLVEVDRREDGPFIRKVLEKMTGRSTVPNVFIDGKSIGGGDETQQLLQSGKLKEMVSA